MIVLFGWSGWKVRNSKRAFQAQAAWPSNALILSSGIGSSPERSKI